MTAFTETACAFDAASLMACCLRSPEYFAPSSWARCSAAVARSAARSCSDLEASSISLTRFAAAAFSLARFSCSRALDFQNSTVSVGAGGSVVSVVFSVASVAVACYVLFSDMWFSRFGSVPVRCGPSTIWPMCEEAPQWVDWMTPTTGRGSAPATHGG